MSDDFYHQPMEKMREHFIAEAKAMVAQFNIAQQRAEAYFAVHSPVPKPTDDAHRTSEGAAADPKASNESAG